MPFRKLLAAASVAASFIGSPSLAATVDLGFAFDDSGSVGATDFALERDGLAAALAQIPFGGDTTYRISVVQFDDVVRTVVPVTTIDSQTTLNSVIGSVQATTQSGGFTAIGDSIAQLTSNFVTSGLGDTTIFNVTTDGQNNRGQDISTAASAAATAGVDALSYEAVGSAATAPLLDTAFPGTPVLITDAADLPDDILATSFVFSVDSFGDYESAISAKIGQIVEDTGGGGPSVIPLPAAGWMLLAGLGALGFAGRRKTEAAA